MVTNKSNGLSRESTTANQLILHKIYNILGNKHKSLLVCRCARQEFNERSMQFSIFFVTFHPSPRMSAFLTDVDFPCEQCRIKTLNPFSLAVYIPNSKYLQGLQLKEINTPYRAGLFLVGAVCQTACDSE